MKDKLINCAVIGLGRMGHRHIEVIQKKGMNLCGIMDISATTLSNTAEQFDIAKDLCFTDVPTLLNTTKPDAVVIATTAPTHAEYTILAAQHQVKHILCEKPMATSLNEAYAMIDACTHYKAQLAINHQMMFLPQYTEIKKIIETGHFGPLSSILVSGSNFGLAMNVSHYFEMFRFLTDSNISTVQAWLEDEKVSNPRGNQFEDYSGSLLAKNAAGTKMYVDFSVHAGHGLQVTYIFKYGQVLVDELSGFVRTICRKEEFKDLPTTRYGMPADTNQYEIAAFELMDSTIKVWDSMLSNGCFPDSAVGLHALHCLVAAIESHTNNSSVIAIEHLKTDSAKNFLWA